MSQRHSFSNIHGAAGWRYSYDPCNPYTEKKCQNQVAVSASRDENKYLLPAFTSVP